MAVSIRILLEENNERERVYQSDGTGYGTAIVSGKLKKETNKSASLEFVIQPSNEKYDSFEKMKSVVYVKYGDKYIFRGRCTDIKTDLFKQRTITCEEDISFLSDSVQPPNKRTGIENSANTKKKKRKTYYGTSGNSTNKNTIKMRPSEYFRSLINEHNSQMDQMAETGKKFQIGNVTTAFDGSEETFERTSHQDTSSVISSELLSIYGGILRTRYSHENNRAYIDWLEEYTDANSQEIQFGVNLIDLDEEPPTDEVWSVLLPIGDDNLTIYAENNQSIYLENSTAIAKYGRIVHYHKFSNCSTAAKLKRKAQRYLNSHSKVFPDNITVTAIDLVMLGGSDDPLEIGDMIKVIKDHDGTHKTMACIEMEFDLVEPENNSYTLGTILPPDKERKKDSISSKQASSSRASASFANQSMAVSDALQSDMQVASNNINVNAENIAVNAQNIAINAENIAIVAQNVSIAADTIDIKAQAITAELSSVDGRIRNKIEVTEQGIVATLNDMLYDEEDGLVTEYEHQLEISAEQTVETFTQTMYSGASGTGTSTDPANGTILKAVYTKSASEWKNELWGENGTRANPANGSIMKQTADAIDLKVSKDGVISSINQTSESITISASKINLNGYVTTSQLEVTNGNFTNLISGVTTATTLKATTLYGTTTYISTLNLGNASGGGSFVFNNSNIYKKSLKLSSADTRATVLGTTNVNDIDLSHSHSVTVGNDGTVTLGGAVATNASGRSFRIADTKTYRDGVSAAYTDGQDSVYVDNLGRDPSYLSDSYNSSTHNTTVHTYATASNGDTKYADIVVYGSNAFSDGAYSVEVNGIACYSSDFYDDDGMYQHCRITVSLDNSRSFDKYLNIGAWDPWNAGYAAGANVNNISVTYVAVHTSAGDADVTVSINGRSKNIHVPNTAVNIYHN